MRMASAFWFLGAESAPANGWRCAALPVQATNVSRGAVPERSSGTRPRSAHGAAPTKEALRHHGVYHRLFPARRRQRQHQRIVRLRGGPDRSPPELASPRRISRRPARLVSGAQAGCIDRRSTSSLVCSHRAAYMGAGRSPVHYQNRPRIPSKQCLLGT